MTQTLERPRTTPENASRITIDLTKIQLSQDLSDTSPYKMRVLQPDNDRVAAVYMAAKKESDSDMLGTAYFAVKEDAEAFWQVNDTEPESMGIVRVGSDGSAEHLGVHDDDPLKGKIALQRNETIYMMPNQLIDALELSREGIDRALLDDVLGKEIVQLSFENAVEDRIDTHSSQTPEVASLDDEEAMPVKTPTPLELAARGHDERATRAAQLVQEMNKSFGDPLETSSAASSTAESASYVDDNDEATPPAEAPFKVTDLRRWSRVDVLGQEIGPHGRIDPAKRPRAIAEQPPAQEVEAPAPSAAVIIESIENPRNDPAIKHAITHLETLRNKAASALSGWREQLLGANTKSRRDSMQEYNTQIATLAKLVMAEQLADTTLTDSQKNILVAKFLVNEQARLRLAMDEKAQHSAAGKFIKWMSVHGRDSGATIDHRHIVTALEQDTSDQPAFTVAHQRLAEIFQKQQRNERRDYLKKSLRIAALGAVGIGATLVGINPSNAGDAINSLTHTGL
jgi:hypothetical protein